MPFASATFDLAVSSLFFHHLSSGTKQQVMNEIRRVIRPKGRLVIADWGKPRDIFARAGFGLVRLLDGFDSTRDSVLGTFLR